MTQCARAAKVSSKLRGGANMTVLCYLAHSFVMPPVFRQIAPVSVADPALLPGRRAARDDLFIHRGCRFHRQVRISTTNLVMKHGDGGQAHGRCALRHRQCGDQEKKSAACWRGTRTVRWPMSAARFMRAPWRQIFWHVTRSRSRHCGDASGALLCPDVFNNNRLDPAAAFIPS